MSLQALIAKWSVGWRGPAAAAFIAFLAGLPGLVAAPVLDRDEARFAQATAQMLETGDLVVIQFQDQPRFKKPVGIHWLQAASVSALSSPEARDIWAYRIPSLLGAMLAAAACAWGAAAFFGGPAGLWAGVLLGGSFLLSTEAFIAKTDAVLAGSVTLAMAAMGRLYAAARGGPAPGRAALPLMWLAIAVSILVKGPVGPLIFGLALITLGLWDRRPRWMTRLRWYWGLIVVLVVVGPWAGAVTVATDGEFWRTALIADLAPKLAGAQENHGAPPGYHTLLTPILAFPLTLLLPAAAVVAWWRRKEAGVRFAVAWFLPALLFFELTPTKLPHYPLPAYGGLALLAAAALVKPIDARARWIGASLGALVGLLLAVGVGVLFSLYGDPTDLPVAILAAVLALAAGLAGAWLMVRDETRPALASALALGMLAHAAVLAGLAPRLDPLWISARTERALATARLLPRQGLADAPVAVAGFAEPSLVFALGTNTQLGGGAIAAKAISEARPAVVEAREEPAFRAALARAGLTARPVAKVAGLNYSRGDPVSLTVYMSPVVPAAAAR